MIVYSNSCSFGAEQEHPVYAELIADSFNASLINAGQGGSCNRRIIRTSLRDLMNLKNQSNTEILCLIGLSYITRTELWQSSIPAVSNDGNFHAIVADHKKFDWTKGLVDTLVPNIHLTVSSQVREYYKQWLLLMSKESIITELCTDLIMFKNFCTQNNIKILIWSNTQKWPGNPEVAVGDIFLKTFVEYITTDKHFIDPWTFSFQQFSLDRGHRPKDELVYGLSGHLDEHAHEDFANFLLKYIKENNIL
jgi:hypothetical protein